MNGTVDVELYDATSPPDSLKAKNPSNAAYDLEGTKTCSNVYCHSGYTVIRSSDVSLPLTYPENPIPPGYQLNGPYIMDSTCSNLTYSPYTVEAGRDHKTTPPWGTTGTFTACTECHAFPLTTYYPAVKAGVGDSHQWVDFQGYNWRHGYNMVGQPIPCRTCHNDTVTAAGSTYWTTGLGGAWITAYSPISLASRAKHVNGTADVAFDKVNGFSYVGPWATARTIDLQSAQYDPANKTCSDVGCHYGTNGSLQLWQQKVKWGGPWRDESQTGAECDLCHRYGYLNRTCTPAP